MSENQTLAALLNLDEKSLTSLIKQLNDEGFLLDENSPELTSTQMEAWNTSCDEFIQNRGFEGGGLSCIGKMISGYGAIYLLYDTEQLTYDQANLQLNSYKPKVP